MRFGRPGGSIKHVHGVFHDMRPKTDGSLARFAGSVLNSKVSAACLSLVLNHAARDTWSPPHSAAVDWRIDLSESVCLVLDVCLLLVRRCDMVHGDARFVCAAATRKSLIVIEPAAVLNIVRSGL